MPSNPYLERLSQLKKDKAESFAARTGLPLNKPLNRSAPELAGGEPAALPMEPKMPTLDELGMDQSTMFARDINRYQQEDKRFGEFMQEYGEFAAGMAHAVKSGYMPEAIAKQRLQQYVNDSSNYFKNNKPTPLDNPKMNAAMEAMFNNHGGGALEGGSTQMQPHVAVGGAVDGGQ